MLMAMQAGTSPIQKVFCGVIIVRSNNKTHHQHIAAAAADKGTSVSDCSAMPAMLTILVTSKQTLTGAALFWVYTHHSALALDGNRSTARELQGPILGLDKLCSFL